ncbi:MAG TPA: hypothetical protein PLT92_13930 [Ignavibacteriaceae bacterium]|nr:hypothetical protein [Ignavibacteriaceae bacterium]
MPRIYYSLRIVDDQGIGIPDSEVRVHYGFTKDMRITDAEGYVTFPKKCFISNTPYIKIYFKGQKLGSLYAENRKVYYLTINAN